MYAVVFLCSFAGLAYEVSLTRVFSLSLSYHFAFLVISIAMLGIGAGGTLLSIFPGLRDTSKLRLYALLLGACITTSYLTANLVPFDPVRLSWDSSQVFAIGLSCLVLAVPFLFSGMVVVAALSGQGCRPGPVYGADLLGAAAGSLGVLVLLGSLGPAHTVPVISSMAFVAALLASGKGMRLLPYACIIVNLLLLVLRPSFLDVRISPYKGLEAALKFPGAARIKTYHGPFSTLDTFQGPASRYAPGLSLRYLDPLPDQKGIAVDAGGITAVTDAADHERLAFLEYLPAALPYALGKKENVLVVDPGGGLPALMAMRYHSQRIIKTESNPLLLRVVKEDLRDFSGDIYGTDSWPVLGRSWLRTAGLFLDLIDISLTGAVPAGSFGIAEDFRLTVDAFREYLGRLKPSGMVSINLYIIPPPRAELRVLSIAIAALEADGVTQPAGHIAAIRSWDSMTLLVKKEPFSSGEVEAVRSFCRSRRFDLVHVPGISEAESNVFTIMPTNEYYAAFQNILSKGTMMPFLEQYLFDVQPVTDDRPFFHHYLKLKNIMDTYRVVGGKWQYFVQEGYILPAVFLQVLVLGTMIIVLPVFRRKRAGRQENRGAMLLPYFGLLGIGYLFVEIVLIQRLILPLGNPSSAVATVIAALLTSSGAGSLLSSRIPAPRHPFVPALAAVLVLVYSLLLPPLSQWLAVLSFPARTAATFAFLIPLGLIMGMPFPFGLRALAEKDTDLIPWAWAINGSLSVLAPSLASMIALSSGFSFVLWLGALAYGLASVLKAGAERGARSVE